MEKTVEVDGLKIRYLEEGSGTPVVFARCIIGLLGSRVERDSKLFRTGRISWYSREGFGLPVSIV